MLTLDHIVVHVSGADEITSLKSKLEASDIPFEPDWGKEAKGLKISNIWIGQQYFEIVNLLSPDNLWQPQWSKRHAEGDRGVYCLFFKTDEDIHELHKKLINKNIAVTEPERTRFKWMFGLLEKKLPWQFMLLPKIPGTPVELGIIQYDRGAEKKHEPFMVPNAKDNGITGLNNAKVYTRHLNDAHAYLENVSRAMGQAIPVQLSEEINSIPNTAVTLKAEFSSDTQFSGFKVTNVVVVS